MKAIQVKGYGPPHVLQLIELAEPKPRTGEVCIRVRAAGINFADILARLGLYRDAPKPPFVPGLEVSGEIESLGQNVSGLSEG